MRVDDMAGNRPGRYCSPRHRHRVPFNSRSEYPDCVSTTWRATSTWPSLKLIPLGGFVAFPDDDPDCPYPEDDPDLLRNRPMLVPPARYCSPRHPTHVEPSLLEWSGMV